jgi:alkylation response protein AidB-like acyl-CoA dehydrogenase
MLKHPEIERELSSLHRSLHREALAFFAEENLARFIDPARGFVTRGLWTELGRQGLLACSLPLELGGRNAGILGDIVVKDALHQRCRDNGLSLGFHVHSIVATRWLMACPNVALRHRLLPLAARGTLLFCTCYTDREPSEPTRAVAEGDTLVITGVKSFVVNGFNADVCMVTALLDGRSSTIVVEKDRPGVSVTRLHDRLGNRLIDQVDVAFADVRVPRANVIAENPAQRLMLWNLVMTYARMFVALDAHQLVEGMLAKLAEYGKARQVSGKPLLSWGVNAQAFARAARQSCLVECGLVDVYRKLSTGQVPVMDAARLKWLAVELATDLGRACCDMEGGMGYMHDGRFATDLNQALGLRMATGSQAVLLEVADAALSARTRHSRYVAEEQHVDLS